jgi:hypothetical protein
VLSETEWHLADMFLEEDGSWVGSPLLTEMITLYFLSDHPFV